MNGYWAYGRLGKEAVVAYLKVLFRYPARDEENYEITSNSLDVRTWDLPNTKSYIIM
jgi:hypothetical protein